MDSKPRWDYSGLCARRIRANGRGRNDHGQTGVIDSHPFLLTEPGLKFTLYGSADEGTSVELIDATNGATLMFARKVSDSAQEVSWELIGRTGSMVVFRLTDDSKKGSIGIGGLRAAKVGPD